MGGVQLQEVSLMGGIQLQEVSANGRCPVAGGVC